SCKFGNASKTMGIAWENLQQCLCNASVMHSKPLQRLVLCCLTPYLQVHEKLCKVA
ncbi:hypothetical protein NDU88_004635, partial [Pleurodeles waltl]